MKPFEICEIVVASQDVWDAIECLLNQHGMYLKPGPVMDEHETPWYFVGLKDIPEAPKAAGCTDCPKAICYNPQECPRNPA